MNIQWNKVTWYSKMLALILFVALPFIGFWLGVNYGKTMAALWSGSGASQVASSTGTATVGSGTGVSTLGAEYYQNVAEWQTDSDSAGGFAIAYPIDFSIDENFSPTPSADWRLNANGTSGNKDLMVTIPSAFDPQTNLADATLTVGRSANKTAVADCLAADPSGGPATATSTMTINGIQFTVFQSSDAGAGNLYQTTSYRTLHGGQCYAVEYTIHSSQIGNYPASYNLQPYDATMVIGVLDRIVGTFTFL